MRENIINQRRPPLGLLHVPQGASRMFRLLIRKNPDEREEKLRILLGNFRTFSLLRGWTHPPQQICLSVSLNWKVPLVLMPRLYRGQ